MSHQVILLMFEVCVFQCQNETCTFNVVSWSLRYPTFQVPIFIFAMLYFALSFLISLRGVSDAQKRNVCKDILRLPHCCLDVGFTLVLKLMAFAAFPYDWQEENAHQLPLKPTRDAHYQDVGRLYFLSL